MRILSPVDRADEVGILADAGADELYGGHVSKAWLRKYSLLGSANQRYFASAQIKDLPELKRIIKAAHGRGLKFYITLNAPYYTAAQYEDMLVEAALYADLGVDAFIVADIGLILRLGQVMPGFPVHLSTLGAVFNSRSAAFFSGLGVHRIVLPRELTVAEMGRIVKANPEVEFDAFVMIGKCPNIEGFCSFTHNSASLVWPCEESYDFGTIKSDGRAEAVIDAQSGWSQVNRRQACGLCAVPGLEKAGITALKIVGRGGPTAVKAGAVKAVRGILENAAGDKKDLQLKARAAYKGLFGRDCNPYVCYFPEVWR